LKNILYHYVHCPYCVRVRIAAGFLNIPLESRVLAYDNVKLPERLAGKKMLPILEFPNGDILNESVDIISKIDDQQILFRDVTKEDIHNTETICNEIGSFLHPLAMPSWLNTPEFYNESKTYFRQKKEKKRGPFVELIKKNSFLKHEFSSFIESFSLPKNFIKGKSLTILDIMVVAHFYGIYTLIDFYIPKDLHDYLQKVRQACDFNYHEDYQVDKIFQHWDDQ